MTNYITHLLDWWHRFKDDDRMSPAHIALYFVLFQEWNRQRFVSPFAILRDEMMGLAKIRSPNVYARCMRELDHWGYIRYVSSYNQWQASHVHLFSFNKRKLIRVEQRSSTDSDKEADGTLMPDLYENTSIDTGIHTTIDNSTDTGAIPASIPFIINELNNNTNKQNLENIYESSPQNSDFSVGRRPADRATPGDTHTDHPSEKEKKRKRRRERPACLEEVKTYFAHKKAGDAEAERFYNYYQSIGWKVGNSHKPMENWRYSATYWIENTNQKKNENDEEQLTLRPGASHVRIDKDYDEPL